ncbi:ORF1 protein [Cacao bacilliform Sri Lanka virus]|uniref:ORF1 protein n=1 Tax=Cacao bacilliform Sri Lanka virus TaxID=2056878 RepID=A0A2H4U993_9VIRU|nr:ORF1 protein [Cacao bacilliform Sri Lanka virus]ATZ69528.1 ORF1 protein [Cacao bacilliform Sri Lanka virus]
MSERFEESIREWYASAPTRNLQYLDLAETPKPKLSQLANNLGVIYDRINLLSRVSLKNYKLILEKSVLIESILTKHSASLSLLESEFQEHRPLTSAEVKKLVIEIAKQPKAVEEQALQITEELKKEIKEVRELVTKVQTLLIS